jgi:DNA polymerase-3 subunit alpha (Gram-positive type)
MFSCLYRKADKHHPARSGGMRENEFVILDIESTGLSKAYDRMTEIAAVAWRDGKVLREFHSLINPQIHIPRFITSLTGIDDDMVRDAPPVASVMPRFLEFLGKRPIVAHNAAFDCGFLDHNAKATAGIGLENTALCTRLLANRLLPHLPSKKLGEICAHFGIRNEQAHRAMGDTRATAHVFSRMSDLLREKGITRLDEALRFQRMPLAHAARLGCNRQEQTSASDKDRT